MNQKNGAKITVKIQRKASLMVSIAFTPSFYLSIKRARDDEPNEFTKPKKSRNREQELDNRVYDLIEHEYPSQ